MRYDLFERLNTGGVRLMDHEVRESVYMGPFVDALTELAQLKDFGRVVVLPRARQLDGTPQDYVLRFFAFRERYQSFEHSVRNFLNEFIAAAAKNPELGARVPEFTRTMAFLAQVFPNGLKSRKGTTPVNLFEGVAVGASLALDVDPSLSPPRDLQWITSSELKKFTTGATNNRASVAGRVEYCRDRFLRP